MNHVINTRADLDRLANTDPVAWSAFIQALKGACVVQTDTAEYPEGYDRSKQPGDAGYVAPNIVETPTETPAIRYEYTRAELMAMNP